MLTVCPPAPPKAVPTMWTEVVQSVTGLFEQMAETIGAAAAEEMLVAFLKVWPEEFKTTEVHHQRREFVWQEFRTGINQVRGLF